MPRFQFRHFIRYLCSLLRTNNKNQTKRGDHPIETNLPISSPIKRSRRHILLHRTKKRTHLRSKSSHESLIYLTSICLPTNKDRSFSFFTNFHHLQRLSKNAMVQGYYTRSNTFIHRNIYITRILGLSGVLLKYLI